MARSQLKIIQVGCGTWGKFVLRDLVSLGAQVTVVARSQAAVTHANSFGAARRVDSLRDLADDTFDGAVVVTPITSHFDVIMTLNELFPSLPIFCEKELVQTSKEAELLNQALGDRLFTMHKWRYHNGILKLKEIIDGGRYGKLKAVKLDRLGWGSSQKDVDSIITAIPHDLSILLEFFGEVRTNFRSVTESTDGWVFSQTLVSAGSPSIVIDVSSHSPVNSRAVQLFFEEATAVLSDSYDDFVAVYRYGDNQIKSPPEPEKIVFEANMPLEKELEAFLNYIAGDGPPPKSSVKESLQVIRALENIRSLQDT
jgi:predicted dehydrogenase